MSILIVDDSEFIHPQLKVYLQHGGYDDLIFRTSAQGAFDVLGLGSEEGRNEAVELVLMDVVMPGMDGIEATRRICADPAFRDLPVIIVTADATPQTLKTALEAGAADYIAKPLNRVELLARVDAAMRLKRETYRRKAQEAELRRVNAELTTALQLINSEMDLVANLQTMLLPRRSPRIPGISVSSFYRPSGRASGDYYDYFRAGEHTLRIVMADVAGHGAQAAFIMAIVRTLFHAGTTCGLDIERTLALVNSSLCETIGDADHVTIFAADMDLEHGRITYLNAGHCPALLLNGSDSVISLPPQAPPAGFVATQYTAKSVEMGPEGRLFLFTDGLFEWQVEPDKRFGMEPFLLLCEELLPREEGFLAAVESRLQTLTGTTPEFTDDLAALLAEWNLENFRAKKA